MNEHPTSRVTAHAEHIASILETYEFDDNASEAPAVINDLVTEVRTLRAEVEAVRALHQRRGRPSITECSCGLIICATLRAIELEVTPDAH